MFEIYFLGIWPNFDRFCQFYMHFQGSLRTGSKADFTGVLIGVSAMKIGLSTNFFFFAEIENITPGPHLERLWNFYDHWEHFYSDSRFDPNLAIFWFTYKLLYKLMCQNATVHTKMALTRNPPVTNSTHRIFFNFSDLFTIIIDINFRQ